MSKIRFGVVGTGSIAHRFANAIQNVEDAELTAVSSRTWENADKFGDEFNIPLRFSDYKDLAKSDCIDVAYIALPHSLHCPVSCEMMEHGKNVICEKPMAVTRKEGKKMFATATENNVFLMEAMWARLVPGTMELFKIAESGRLGKIRSAECKFCYRLDDSEMGHHVLKNANGGGSLLDVGVYCLNFLRWFMGENVSRIAAFAEDYKETDSHLTAILKYQNGDLAQFSSATLLTKPSEGYIYGEKGYVHVDRFYAPQSIEIVMADGTTQTIQTPYQGNGFEEQIAHVCQCLREGKKRSPLCTEDGTLFILRQMDTIRKQVSIAYPQDKD